MHHPLPTVPVPAASPATPKSPTPPPAIPCSTTHLSLLDLTPDLLRATAFWLPPQDRLNLALTCRLLFNEVWGHTAITELTERFPVERRLQFTLSVNLPSNKPFATSPALRAVPQRMRQQHVSVAVTSDAAHVAVLPYDNKLRLIDMAHSRVDDQFPLSPPFYCYDIWDVAKGRRTNTTPREPGAAYADQAGLDIDVGLEFSADDALLLVSGRTRVSLYRRERRATRAILRHERDILLDDALMHILGRVDYTMGVGGSATLSPDGMSLAWVVFSGSPASVFVTFWDVARGRCRSVCEVTTIHPRRWSALGWARVAYAPNGAYCVLIVNAAKKIMRIERTAGAYQRTKLCRYILAAFDSRADARASSSDNAEPGSEILNVAPIRERCEWLELTPNIYARDLGSAVASLLDGLHLQVSMGLAYNRGEVELSQRRQLAERSLTFNSLHTCPAEATYKGLSFGPATRHPWFITKQPMYSLHFAMSGQRIHVATSPHSNKLMTLVRKSQPEGEDDMAVVSKWDFDVVEPASDKRGWERGRMQRTWREGPGKRRHVFKLLPWRTSFATVTAFSSTGKWVAGASLLDDDRCCVCLRNMTLKEYFG